MTVAELDGDKLRQGLCSDLSFSPEDRSENIRRVAEVARLMIDLGHIVVCSFIAPYQTVLRNLVYPHNSRGPTF
jgi:adenylylsulfate kinase